MTQSKTTRRKKVSQIIAGLKDALRHARTGRGAKLTTYPTPKPKKVRK